MSRRYTDPDINSKTLFCSIFQGLDAGTLTDFVGKVNNATKDNEEAIVQSEATVSAMVEILKNIADVTQTVMLDEGVITVSKIYIRLHPQLKGIAVVLCRPQTS